MEEGAELDEYLEKLVDVDESIDVDEVDTPSAEIKRLKNIKFRLESGILENNDWYERVLNSDIRIFF